MSDKYEGRGFADDVSPEEIESADDRYELFEPETGEQGERTLNQEVPRTFTVDDEALRADPTRAATWLTRNKGLEQNGFSPADKLTPENVSTLQHEWTIDGMNPGMEANPIIIPGDPPVTYFTEPGHGIYAANARTGEIFWQSQPELPDPLGTVEGGTSTTRGAVAYKGKVFQTIPNLQVIAYDRFTGEQLWKESFLAEDQVRIRNSVTSPPMVYNDRLFLPQSGDSDPVGFSTATAMDPATGEILWRKKTAPKNLWVGDTWQFASSGPWLTPSYDTQTDTIVFHVGQPGPQHTGIPRPGPNKWTNSLIAMDPETGELKWGAQQLPHELWDYDTSGAPNIFTMEVDGEPRRVVSVDQKDGWTYVYDMEDGALLERTRAFTKQDHEWGDGFLLNVPYGRGNKGVMWPGETGGTEWPANSFSPQTGLRYIGAIEGSHWIWGNPSWEWPIPGDHDGGHTPEVNDQPAHVFVRAVDLSSGEIKWSTEYSGYDINSSLWELFPGGTTATAGGLVFGASPAGYVVAFDAQNGDKLWRAKTGRRNLPSPIVWTDPNVGKQYVTIAAYDKVVTFSSKAGTQSGNQ